MIVKERHFCPRCGGPYAPDDFGGASLVSRLSICEDCVREEQETTGHLIPEASWAAMRLHRARELGMAIDMLDGGHVGSGVSGSLGIIIVFIVALIAISFSMITK